MVGDKIKELRTRDNMLQQDLANKLNVSKAAVGMWETNKRTPDLEMLKKIADYFNVSVDFLTSDTLSFDFYPHGEDDAIVICPICGHDYTHFQKIINVDFKNTKSYGIALEFFCEMDHIFYIVIESYKGNSYFIFTDGSTIIKTMGIPEYESNPQKLIELWNSEKFNGLDDYGKDVVNTVLEKELTRTNEQRERHTNVIELNFIDAPVSAGLGDMLEDYENCEKVFVPLTSESRRADFILKIYGDSMEPKFSDGDYILVRQQPTVDEGQIGIFGYDGKGYVKKFGGDRLISLNKKYSDIYIDESARCFGIVLGKTDIIDE